MVTPAMRRFLQKVQSFHTAREDHRARVNSIRMGDTFAIEDEVKHATPRIYAAEQGPFCHIDSNTIQTMIELVRRHRRHLRRDIVVTQDRLVDLADQGGRLRTFEAWLLATLEVRRRR